MFLDVAYQLLAASAIATFLFFGEEFGWRGYLTVRIAPGKPLLAAILTGLIWGIYHFPFVILGISFSGNLIALLIYPIDCILGSIFLGWLRTKSDSVWPACLAHSVGNQFLTPVIALLLPGTSFMLAWGAYTLAGYAVLALALILTRQVPWREMSAEPA